jgi:hypothetical protein
MRWLSKESPKIGDTRIKSHFLWLPKCATNVNDKKEWRWFEDATYEQEYCDGWDDISWYNTIWIDKSNL